MKRRLFAVLSVVLFGLLLVACGDKNYKVTFDVAGGTPAIASQTIKKDGLVTKPSDPTKDGYTFKLWEEKTSKKEWKFATDKVTKNITLIAQWEEVPPEGEKVTVTFEMKGGTPAVAAQTIDKGAKATKPADPTKDGFEFLGWYKGETAYNFTAAVNENLTLEAKWEELIVKTYQLEFVVTVPENTEGDVYVATSLNEWAYEKLVKQTAGTYKLTLDVTTNKLTLEYKYDNDHDGQYPETDLSGADRENRIHNFVSGFNLIEDTVLGWKDGGYKEEDEQVTVSFDLNYQNALPLSPQTLEVGAKAIRPFTPTREGYLFVGWYLNDEVYNFAEAVLNDITLIAHWEERLGYTLEYHLNGGSFVYGTKELMVEGFLMDLYDYLSPLESLSDFMHGQNKTTGFDGLWHGYVSRIFAGGRPEEVDEGFFYSSSKYMEKWLPFFDVLEDFVKYNPEQSFYGDTWAAGIRIRQYIIGEKPAQFWPDSQLELMPEIPISYQPPTEFEADQEVVLPKPYHETKTFLGWYDNPNFVGNPIAKIELGTTENKVLYAKWS